MNFHQIISNHHIRSLFLKFVSQQLEQAPADVRTTIQRSKVARELFMAGAVIGFNAIFAR